MLSYRPVLSPFTETGTICPLGENLYYKQNYCSRCRRGDSRIGNRVPKKKQHQRNMISLRLHVCSKTLSV